MLVFKTRLIEKESGVMINASQSVPSIFFSAMQAGYVKNPPKGTILEMSGSKTISFQLDGFRLLDCYLVGCDSYSFGQTIIWCRHVPLWVMSYQGWYQDGAISFLKQALKSAYERRHFWGGRGPHFFTEEGMTYINNVEPPNSWQHFRGREEIFDRNGESAGWHEYQGMLLDR